MALKATIFKAQLQLADMDRGVYADHAVTLARHPSETDERMMVRLLVFALNVPADANHGALEFAKGLWDPDEPELWLKDLTGQIVHWIEVGQPDERRLMKASGRAERVTVVSYSQSTPIWWAGIATKITRARNIAAWQIAAHEAQALAGLARRSMQLQVSVQDGTAWVGDGERSVEISPVRLNP
ncbi:MAG TPA: YaeQ family protein [Caldimonas sp.]